MESFERHLATRLVLPRAINDPHAATRNDLDKLVPAEVAQRLFFQRIVQRAADQACGAHPRSAFRIKHRPTRATNQLTGNHITFFRFL